MRPVLPEKWPEEHSNNPVEEDHQEDFELPVSRVMEQRPERLMHYPAPCSPARNPIKSFWGVVGTS